MSVALMLFPGLEFAAKIINTKKLSARGKDNIYIMRIDADNVIMKFIILIGQAETYHED